MSIDAVVVDLDDTLIASARARRRARGLLREFGVDPRCFAAADRRWWRIFQAGGCSIEELRVGRLADCGVTGAAAIRASAAYRAAANSVRLRLGARALLRSLRLAGLRTVILTNGTVDPQRTKLDEARLAELVDGVIVTEEVGAHKPDPRAFEAALSLVGGAPERAAMVGDTLDADVDGALQAGFERVVWITTRRRAHPDPRVVRVRRLDQVLPALVPATLPDPPRA
jgi:putative hydrolase of the HAD superfamily